MNDDIAISVHNLGKRYMLYDQPQDRLKQSLLWRFGRSYAREFWALRNVSFEVRRGESVGIIGRNGSGKSTLLQMIAGTLRPTEGEVQVNGRVSALLELGAGFNPEFTGRENVYLNGAILGLSHAEIERRIHDIIDFADIGQYLDQPVKLYSSGMFARLAFAVAVEVEPDILIVDEILAVGDYGFQQRCVARIRQMMERGLTLLFVSHGPDTIKDVCQTALYLHGGQTVMWGTSDEVVARYLQDMRELANQEALRSRTSLGAPVAFQTNVPAKLRYGTGHAQIERVEVTDDTGTPRGAFEFGEYINIHVYFKTFVDIDHLNPSFGVSDSSGITILGTTFLDERVPVPSLAAGSQGHVRFRFPNILKHGTYGIGVGLNQVTQPDFSDNIVLDVVRGSAAFVVLHNPERPIWYKVFAPVDLEFDTQV